MKLIRSIVCVTSLFLSIAASTAHAMPIPDEQAAAAAAKQAGMQTTTMTNTQQCPCADTDTKAMCDKKQCCHAGQQCDAKKCSKNCQKKKCAGKNCSGASTSAVNPDMDAQETTNSSTTVKQGSSATTKHTS